MSVVLVPSRSSTTVHEFTGFTTAGREVAMTVTAAVDVKEAAVLADLKASMSGVSDLKARTQDEEPGLLGAMGILFFLWIVIAFVVSFLCIVLDGAGFVDFYDRWPNNLPILGGRSIGQGLFRLWLVGLPFVSIAFPLLLWLMTSRNSEAMKLGR